MWAGADAARNALMWCHQHVYIHFDCSRSTEVAALAFSPQQSLTQAKKILAVKVSCRCERTHWFQEVIFKENYCSLLVLKTTPKLTSLSVLFLPMQNCHVLFHSIKWKQWIQNSEPKSEHVLKPRWSYGGGLFRDPYDVQFFPKMWVTLDFWMKLALHHMIALISQFLAPPPFS